MIIASPEFDKFVVEPWMELEPFDPKLIKKITLNHPYKILLWVLDKYYPSYHGKEMNANPDCDGYEDVTDFYFSLLDDYNRFGIAFQREDEISTDYKLGVFKYKDFEKNEYHLVRNRYDKKVLLFNKVKTIDLEKYDSGKKPLSEEEKLKRNMIKKQTNKKLQVVLMDPDVYNNDKLLKRVIERDGIDEILIEKFNNRMTYHGFYDFLRINFD